MRLASLNPKLVQVHGVPTFTHEFSFDCPSCGTPYRIFVCCKLNGQNTPGVWLLSLPDAPSGDGWNGFTLSPSIQNNTHGRRKVCGYHCSIVNGDVVP